MPVSDRPACHWRILANAGVALSVLLLLALNAPLVWAQGSASGAVRPTSSSEEIIGVGKVATAVRIEDEITLDGYLDEPAWRLALPAGDFIQKLPRNGEPAMNRTEARFLYDDDNLYIGILCFDSNPDQITINELTEDFDWQTDFVGVVLDTLRDRRSGFMFIANPAGARRDGQLANDGDSNFDWDGVWDVEVSRNGEGWIAEFRIPFKTLRFSDAPIQEWGLNLERPTRYLNEMATWTHIPVRYNVSRVSLAGTLNGLEGIRQGRNLKIKPFVAGGFTQARNRQDLAAGLVSDQHYDGGFDLKYGLTQTLTLDATYRTDFAQVEVDQQQVNLTRFNLFFPEKREFFLENAATFAFGSGDNSNLVPFFSRRIGLSDDGTPLPIVGGARVSGQVDRYDLGVLTMKTEASGQTPSNNFIVGRIKRNLLSNSWVGALVTSRDSNQAGDYNRVYGADAQFQFFSRLEFDAYLLRSDTPGLQGENLARKFGTAWRDDELIVAGAYEAVQSNFNPEVGFIRRRDVSQYTGELAWTPFIESSDSIRNLVFATTLEYFEDGTTDQIETRTQNMNLGIQFLNGASIDFTAGKTFDRLLEPFEIRSGVVIPRGDYSYNRYDFGVSTNSSEKISGGAGIDWGEFWDGDRTSFRGDVQIRPNYHMNFSLEYSRNKIDLPNGRFTTDLVGLRFDYGFTPRAFFNAFVQYNADTNEVSSNLRFHLIHHPLSDLFIVYNDRRDAQRGGLIDRALIVKFTNLFNF